LSRAHLIQPSQIIRVKPHEHTRPLFLSFLHAFMISMDIHGVKRNVEIKKQRPGIEFMPGRLPFLHRVVVVTSHAIRLLYRTRCRLSSRFVLVIQPLKNDADQAPEDVEDSVHADSIPPAGENTNAGHGNFRGRRRKGETLGGFFFFS
jgi:hypothetical protein